MRVIPSLAAAGRGTPQLQFSPPLEESRRPFSRRKWEANRRETYGAGVGLTLASSNDGLASPRATATSGRSFASSVPESAGCGFRSQPTPLKAIATASIIRQSNFIGCKPARSFVVNLSSPFQRPTPYLRGHSTPQISLPRAVPGAGTSRRLRPGSPAVC